MKEKRKGCDCNCCFTEFFADRLELAIDALLLCRLFEIATVCVKELILQYKEKTLSRMLANRNRLPAEFRFVEINFYLYATAHGPRKITWHAAQDRITTDIQQSSD